MKKSLVIALALMLVLAFASSAMAAQALDRSTTPGHYEATTKTFVYDNMSTYPYEIYLPNEANPANYRIHSNYAKNTDACASCHSTHTAVGNSLLQWASVRETCMACHDGTLGNATYNVEEGFIGETSKATFGGMFGIGTEDSLSTHNVSGLEQNSAAPGGSITPVTVGGKTRWAIEFGCAACHTPHANGGNARILHPDPNFAATNVAATKAAPFTYYVSSVDGTVYSSNTDTAPVYILKGYPYIATVSNSAYTISNKSGYSIVYFGNSVATGTVGLTVYGTAALQVKMTITNYLSVNENVQHVAGMNAYCGACHTDYNTESVTNPSDTDSGIYANAHRHKVGSSAALFGYGNTQAQQENFGLKFESGKLECLTCHVAHGTSENYWVTTLKGLASADGSSWANDNTSGVYDELAGSSALKRLPNMGTCEACHQKGVSSEGYNANAGITGYSQIAKTGTYTTFVGSLVTNQWYIGDNISTSDAIYWVGSAKCNDCHANIVTTWKKNRHQTAGSTRKGSCGGLNLDGTVMNCHQLGTTAKGLAPSLSNTVALNTAAKAASNPYYYLSSGDKGQDSAVTCEACHGRGDIHAASPSINNIYNPGKILAGETNAQAFERQNKSCGICHNDREPAGTVKNMTVAQINDETMHDGPSAYGQSKHYTSGAVGCMDCHDPHASNVVATGGTAAITVLPYEELCSTCHGSATIGSVDDTMGGGGDHSFYFGTAGASSLPATATATISSFVYNGFNPNTGTVTSMTYANFESGIVALAAGTPNQYSFYSNRFVPDLRVIVSGTRVFSQTDGTGYFDTTASGTGVAFNFTSPTQDMRLTFAAGKVTQANTVGLYKFRWDSSNSVTSAAYTTVFEITN